MADQASVIIQLPRGGALDLLLAEHPPSAVASGRVVLEHLPANAAGRLEAPAAGEVVLSVMSPAALARGAAQVREVIRRAADTGQPLVILVQAAEELREDEINAVLAAAEHARRAVLLRIMGGA